MLQYYYIILLSNEIGEVRGTWTHHLLYSIVCRIMIISNLRHERLKTRVCALYKNESPIACCIERLAMLRCLSLAMSHDGKGQVGRYYSGSVDYPDQPLNLKYLVSIPLH